MRASTSRLVYCVGLLLLGGQLLSIGILAELTIAYHDRGMKTYSVSDRAGPPDTPAS